MAIYTMQMAIVVSDENSRHNQAVIQVERLMLMMVAVRKTGVLVDNNQV